MNWNNFLLIFLLFASSVFGQDIGITEVEILQGYSPSIADANRLNENAIFLDTVKKKRFLEYNAIDSEFISNFKIKPLNAAEVKNDKIQQLSANQINIGFGSAWTNKSSIVHNSKRSKSISYSIIANHFSNKYSLSKNSKNILRLSGKKITSNYILFANFMYDRKTNLYLNNDQLLSSSFYRNRFSYSKISFSLTEKVRSDFNLVSSTHFFVSDFNEMSENQIHISTILNKNIRNTPFIFKISFDNYLNYNNPDSRFTNTDYKSLSFTPATSFRRNGLDFDLSVDLDFNSDNSALVFFPQLEFSNELVKNLIFIKGGLNHKKERHTYKSLSDSNPFIHTFGTNQFINYKNSFLQKLKTTDYYEFYFYLRNKLSDSELLETEISYAMVTDFAHFVMFDNDVYSRFKIDYLESVQQTNINVHYKKILNRIITLKANATYFSWNKNVNNRSKFKLDLRLPINLRSKIKITPTFTYFGERIILAGKLPSQFHANLSFSYIYSNQLTAFLSLNNLSNSKNDIWYGYKEVGFNGLFGISFSF